MMNKLSIKYASLIVCLAITFSACKKKQTFEPDPIPDEEVVFPGHIKQPHGEIKGEKIQATIGAAGGNLSVPNNALQLTVPAGALDDDVIISIQEVTNTMASGSIGKSYRLLPDDVQFKKDVEISIPLSDTTGMVLLPDWVYMTYQDKHGYWHCAKNSVYDELTKTMKVKTRHFSDWTLMQAITIKNNGKDELDGGEQTSLEIQITQPPIESIDDLIDPPYSLDASKIGDWKLFFSGSPEVTGVLTGNGFSASYKAPAKIENYLNMSLYVDLKNLNDFSDPNRPYRGQALRLTYNLQLMPDEYAKFVLGGNTSYLLYDVTTRSQGGKLHFYVRDASRGHAMQIEAPDFSLGTKPYGDQQTYVTLTSPYYGKIQRFTSYYTACGSTVYLHAPGNIKLSADRDKLIKGEIHGALRTTVAGGCETVPITIEGTFRLKKQ
ncbi:hypothetical protein [Pedobacter ginsengisoli]|uniref:hypothetical protein n=1 Tax=Pedobacter ginsengisoli TaxID=363852 RepID=UPI002550BFFE|nr:hypothetical protein [Pedobacter ginsengisoli]